ncbi:la-related protein 6a [Carcharodon carcharias]|uniref:la-related protein 6a n=1 Tax=Carcharodon carcharias TaxID=13397 RepID=UPI001B7E5977|nr:la-related protein 6a [Carcharodon carcharias]
MYGLQSAFLRWAVFLVPPPLRESLLPGGWIFSPGPSPSPRPRPRNRWSDSAPAGLQPQAPAPAPAQAPPRGGRREVPAGHIPPSAAAAAAALPLGGLAALRRLWLGLTGTPALPRRPPMEETEPPGPQLPPPGEAPRPPPAVRIQVAPAEEETPSPPHSGQPSPGEAEKPSASFSGAENDLDELDSDWRSPDPELMQKLIAQIEYYLSDENLEKDAFLLKHVRRNKMGYVSVKLLTSFKKVKHLTRDWQTTAFALKHSQLLELNEEGRKVRRKTAVPVFPSENLPSRMLLVHDMHVCPEFQVLNQNQESENGGLQEKVMEYILKAFGLFGTISSVRVLKPGKELPADVKRLSNRYSQLGIKECVIVEFEDVESAIKAHESLGKTDEGMKVVLIGMKPRKKKVVREKTKEAEDVKNGSKSKSANKRVEELQYVGEDSSAYSSSEPESNPASPMLSRKLKPNNQLSPNTYQNNHLSPNASPRSSPWNSPRSSPSIQRKNTISRKSPLTGDAKLTAATSPEVGSKWTDYSSDSSNTPSGSPWVQRRKQAQVISHENSPVDSPMLSRKMHNAGGLPQGVVRLPRGPDGTKGFQTLTERSKPLVI